MGVVWAAVNQLTEREVALKLIPSAASKDVRARLLREARACGRITHRNVVEIYDVGETADGAPFLVMQLLSGETLQARLVREKRLPQALAVRIGGEIAKGLVAAHGAHIVHRDLKPGNIFLHSEGGDDFVVKLLDFGVSKLLTRDVSSTTTGSAIGSPAYMSPEQAKGLKDVGPRADLWALGVVLFEMVAGRRPFDGETPYAVVAEILSGEIPLLEVAAPGTDPQLCALVARCLERDLMRRVSSATEVQFTLQSVTATFRGSEPVLGARRSAPPAGPTVESTMPPRRSVNPIAMAPAEPLEREPSGPAGSGELLEMPDAPTAAIPWGPGNQAWMPEERETVKFPLEQPHGVHNRAFALSEPTLPGPGAFRDPLAPGVALGGTPQGHPALAAGGAMRSQWPTGPATQDPAAITSTSAVLAPGAVGSAPLSFAPGASLPSHAPGPPPPSVRTLLLAAALSVLGVVTIAIVILVLRRGSHEPTNAKPTSAVPEAIGGASAAPGAFSAAAQAPPGIAPAWSAPATTTEPLATSSAAPASPPPKVAVDAPKTPRPTGTPGTTAPKPSGTSKGIAPTTKKKSGSPAPRATW